jgi:Uma2 family endonuclease
MGEEECMSIISTPKMTAQQFLQLGEDPPGVRLELVDGEIAVSPSPNPSHAYVVAQLTALLVRHVRAHKIGRVYPDVDTILGKYLVRRPDILYFSKNRLHFIGEKAMEGAPDLCIEVISPSSGVVDRDDKLKQYQKAGVQYYWLVVPRRRSIEAYTLARGKYRASGDGKFDDVVKLPPFEALEIPLGDLWQPED